MVVEQDTTTQHTRGVSFVLPRVASREAVLRLVSMFVRPNFLIMVEAGFHVEQFFKCFFLNRTLFAQPILEQIVKTILVEQNVSGPLSIC